MVQAELSDLAAETVVTAIHAFTDPPAAGDRRSPARRRADALVRIAEVALAVLPEHVDRARTRATIVVDWATLTGDGEFTGAVHPDEVDRALCDASVSRVVTGPERQVLDAGRTRRTVPPALRRALVARDRGCRYPGCDRPPGWCDAHHVVHWRTGGRTDVTNLVLLCDHHHHVVHRPGWGAALDDDGLHVHRPDGVEIS